MLEPKYKMSVQLGLICVAKFALEYLEQIMTLSQPESVYRLV